MKAHECTIGTRVAKTRFGVGLIQQESQMVGTIIGEPQRIKNAYGFEVLVQWDNRSRPETVNIIRLFPHGEDQVNRA